MSRVVRAFCGAAVLVSAIGIAAPAGFGTSAAWAQPESIRPEPSEETARKIRLAQDALDEVQATLESDSLYVPAIDGLNYLAILTGGLDARADLDGDGGVDPFTFVGLYSGQAVEEVAPNLSWDESGRRIYNDNVIKLYPLARLQKMFHQEFGKQPELTPGPLSKDLLGKMELLYGALREAQGAMEIEKMYIPAVKGLNPFAVSVGGVNAIADLERDLGVDPVTFVGLYAGQAVEGVQDKLGKDEFGRLTYKNRLIRLYPISRLKALEAERLKLSIEEE
jgi:hypothetical protein